MPRTEKTYIRLRKPDEQAFTHDDVRKIIVAAGGMPSEETRLAMDYGPMSEDEFTDLLKNQLELLVYTITDKQSAEKTWPYSEKRIKRIEKVIGLAKKLLTAVHGAFGEYQELSELTDGMLISYALVESGYISLHLLHRLRNDLGELTNALQSGIVKSKTKQKSHIKVESDNTFYPREDRFFRLYVERLADIWQEFFDTKPTFTYKDYDQSTRSKFGNFVKASCLPLGINKSLNAIRKAYQGLSTRTKRHQKDIDDSLKKYFDGIPESMWKEEAYDLLHVCGDDDIEFNGAIGETKSRLLKELNKQ